MEEKIDELISILKTLTPADVAENQELNDLVVSLFGKKIKRELMENVACKKFIKEKKSMLNKLEKIHNQVQQTHAEYVQSSACTGINAIRETRAATVNALGLAALTTQSALNTLHESAYINDPNFLLEGATNSSTPLLTGGEEFLESEKKSQKGVHNAGAVVSDGSCFRMGGLGRSRGRKSKFSMDKVFGMYDGFDEEDADDNNDDNVTTDGQASSTKSSSKTVRRLGTIVFEARAGCGGDGGWLCYVIDDEDQKKRACAHRTIIDISGALAGLGKPLLPTASAGGNADEVLDTSGSISNELVPRIAPRKHKCSYVRGTRLQRWALLGGEIPDLSGETAMAVRLVLDEEEVITNCTTSAATSHGNSDPTSDTDATSHGEKKKNIPGESGSGSNERSEVDSADHPVPLESLNKDAPVGGYVVPPLGSFRRHCNVCKQPYAILHPFYHQLCGRCGDLNLQKRLQTADLDGYVALVTGGRVRIGYQICLKLLRAGAKVITTTRWPQDAALRYSHEADYNTWKHLLTIEEVELNDVANVEKFCDKLLKTVPRLHILINNAAQTITRPAGWTEKMARLEVDTTLYLTNAAKETLSCLPSTESNPSTSATGDDKSSSSTTIITSGDMRKSKSAAGTWITLDESGQPLDLSGVNSWSRRLGDVGTSELTLTMNVTAIAPFIFCSRLKPIMATMTSEKLAPQTDSVVTASHSARNIHQNNVLSGSVIVNVTALEGKFNVGKKSSGHPHTNMAKAALNMMTLTAARDFSHSQIYMSSVDTGWVTDMSPMGIGATSRIHETFIGPPLDDEDGAARVLDPVFSYVNSNGTIKMFGHFYKDYMKASW